MSVRVDWWVGAGYLGTLVDWWARWLGWVVDGWVVLALISWVGWRVDGCSFWVGTRLAWLGMKRNRWVGGWVGWLMVGWWVCSVSSLITALFYLLHCERDRIMTNDDN